MSHFYGTIKGNRGEATRCGHRTTGLTTTAASWAGAIETHLYVNDEGLDCYRIVQKPWKGNGSYRVIAEGRVGE